MKMLITMLAVLSAGMPCHGLAGSPISEPFLLKRHDILFYDGFDGKNWGSNWHNSHDRGYRRVESPVSYIASLLAGKPNLSPGLPFWGAGVLECEHHAGTHDPSEMTVTIPGQDVAYIRWYRRWEDGYDWTQHKMPGFYAKADPRKHYGAGIKPTGTDKFSAKLYVSWNRAPMIYSYHPDQEGVYGDGLKQNVGSSVYLETGRWYCFELMLKANTPPAHDGEIKMWVDGELKAHYKDMRFRDVPDLKINSITHSAYVGGTWVAKRQQKLWDDNLAVATGYIGPVQVQQPARKKPAKKRPKRPPKPQKPPQIIFDTLHEARSVALKKGFNAAAQMLDKAAPTVDEEFRHLFNAPRGAYLSAAGMKWWVIEGVAAGKHENVLVRVMGNAVRAKLVGATENGLVVSFGGMEIPKQWDDFSAVRLVDLFNRYKPAGREADDQLADLRKALAIDN